MCGKLKTGGWCGSNMLCLSDRTCLSRGLSSVCRDSTTTEKVIKLSDGDSSASAWHTQNIRKLQTVININIRFSANVKTSNLSAMTENDIGEAFLSKWIYQAYIYRDFFQLC